MSLFNHFNSMIKSVYELSFITAIILMVLSIPQAQAAPFAYISNFNSDNVSVIDTENHTVGSPIAVGAVAGASPWGVAVSSDGSKVYVANSYENEPLLDGSLSVIDTSDNSVQTIAFPGSSPRYLALSPDDSLLYVATDETNVMVVDVQLVPPAIIETIPAGTDNRGIAVHPNAQWVYVSDRDNASVLRINASHVVDATIPVGDQPFDIAVTPDGSKLYVASEGFKDVPGQEDSPGLVSVIDAVTLAVTTIELLPNSRARGVTVHPFLDRAYVSSWGRNTVSVIDTLTDTVIKVITDAGIEQPRGLTVHPDGSRVYVTGHASDNVHVIDTATNTVMDPPSPILVGHSPGSVGQFIAPGEKYSIGGTVSGLTGTIVLLNNGWDESTVTADGGFTFDIKRVTEASYNVTVKAYPEDQACTVTNGSGTISGGNVTDVLVDCEAGFTIGGNISGLTGTVTLQNNGGDDLTLSSDGLFTFHAPAADDTTYRVTVVTQPIGQTCTVTNGFGTVSGSDVTDVQVTCKKFPWVIYNPAFVVPAEE